MQQVKARGNVENWLGLVEESMMVSLKKLTKVAIIDFDSKERHEWVTKHASQVSLSLLYVYVNNLMLNFKSKWYVLCQAF